MLRARCFSTFRTLRFIPPQTGDRVHRRGEYNEDAEGQTDLITRSHERAEKLKVPLTHFMGNVNYHETVNLIRETLDYLQKENISSTRSIVGPGANFWKSDKDLEELLQCKLSASE